MWRLGTRAEATYGSRATAALYAFLAVTSSAAQFAWAGPGIGLSGVGYGLCGLLAVAARRDPRLAGAVDGNTARLFVSWFLLCWVLTAAGAWHVANAAHAAGAAFGALLGVALVARKSVRLTAGAGLATAAALVVAAAARKGAADELAYAAWRNMDAGRNQEAAAKLERAVERDPSQPDWWTNLGVARLRLGRVDGAVEAYDRAARLRPWDLKRRADLLGATGYRRQTGGDLVGAIRDYREAVAADPLRAWIWNNLGTALAAKGEAGEAGDAFRRAARLEPGNKAYRDAVKEADPPGSRD